jgi:methanogenic corrinoid protein MtbC1
VASELLSVHESSIKRWCNAGELDYWTTPGGHRRIPIGRLVSFARDRGLESEINHFNGAAERVWIGLEEARKQDNYTILSKLVLEWINLGRIGMVERLVVFLMHQNLSLSSIFDQVLADAMSRVGSAYLSKKLSIGEEHRLTSLIRDALLGIRNVVTANGKIDSEASERTAVVGCIRGEMHEIGAIMIRLILLNDGWNVVYLGQDVPTEEYHSQAVKHDAELICISMAPPRGETDASDAVKLLSSLFGPGNPIRIVFGGSLLGDVTQNGRANSFAEVGYFNNISLFQDWVEDLSA